MDGCDDDDDDDSVAAAGLPAAIYSIQNILVLVSVWSLLLLSHLSLHVWLVGVTDQSLLSDCV